MRYVRHLAGVVILAGTLSLGMAQQATASSADVAALQVALKAMDLYPVAVDGVKGPFTSRGVRAFQQRRRLLVDGVAGPQTRRALGRRGRPSLGSRVMHRGQRGWDVAALQFLLARRGYRPGGFDGGFGGGTHTALVSFQRAAGLTVDGLAGAATLRALRDRSGGPTRTPSGPVASFAPSPARSATGSAPRARAAGATRASTSRCATAPASAPPGSGTTVFAGCNNGGYGNLVVVQHRLGYTTWYAHMSRITTWAGEHVERRHAARLRRLDRALDRAAPALRGAPQQRADQPGAVPAGRHRGAGDGRAVKARCKDPAAYASAKIDDCR